MATVNKSALIKAISAKTFYSNESTKYVLDAILEVIETFLKQGDCVAINDFGSFNTKKRSSRVGHNFGTGEVINIPERTSVVFKPSDRLKDFNVDGQE